jgi:hypothetical protein
MVLTRTSILDWAQKIFFFVNKTKTKKNISAGEKEEY